MATIGAPYTIYTNVNLEYNGVMKVVSCKQKMNEMIEKGEEEEI